MLGLGHAIYLAHETFDKDGIFIILGDTVFDVNLKDVFKNDFSALGVKKVEDPKRFGVAILKRKRVIKLVEKPVTPVSNLALVGLYFIKNSKLLKQCLEDLFEKNIKTGGEFQLTDALQLMVNKGERITTFNVDGWYDCGKPETLLSTNRFLLSKDGTKKRISSVVINHPVYIDKSAIIKNSVIGPFTTISRNCVIENSNIRNSIIGSGSSIEKALLEDSLIGNDSIIKGKFVKLNSGDSSEIEFY